MKISRNPLAHIFWLRWLGPAWAPVCLCLCGLAGCGGKSASDDKDVHDTTPTTAEQTPAEEDLIPKGATLVRESTEPEYYPNGALRRERGVRLYTGDLLINHGPYKELYPGGKPFITGSYDSGKRVGDWTFFHKNGQLAHREHYENGKLEGAWSMYREDGTKSDDVSYHNNKKNGTWAEYDAAGKPTSQREVKDGVQHGMRTEFYPSGKKKAEGRFTEGKFDGLTTHWYENGQKKLEIAYRMGLKNGKEIEYNEQGEPTSTREYRDGKLLPAKKSG